MEITGDFVPNTELKVGMQVSTGLKITAVRFTAKSAMVTIGGYIERKDKRGQSFIISGIKR